MRFRVWAPLRKRVDVLIAASSPGVGVEERPSVRHALAREENGYWSATIAGLQAGARYWFCLDQDETPYPDPRSRFQPQGPHGPSQVVDASSYVWHDQGWRGASLQGQVLYELHIGTFTQEGTWDAARARLPHLRALGVSALEVMPVGEFPGDFGWGYDGVNLFAPYHRYGAPDDFRRFVDDAHGLGLAVILDVVYNHLGPDGNFLRQFSPFYFSHKATDWGDALNFDGEHCHGMRSFVIDNACQWIADYHLDGLRLDATQSIFDESPEHILRVLGQRAREAAEGREIILIAENEPQHTRLVRPIDQDGLGLDALWNDDLHHSAVVALTGRSEAYYSDHLGSPQELISAVKHGYLYQGQRYAWQKQARGSSARGLSPQAFVAFFENHDQVANSSTGERLWQLTSAARHRALTALLLLAPWTPMLFQGEEWCSERPFFYFAHHQPELAHLVSQGRATFLRQFPSYAAPDAQAGLRDPAAAQTFLGSKLDWSELENRARATQSFALYRDLLALRQTDGVVGAQAAGRVQVDGAVLGAESFALRFFGPDDDDRLLIINLGRDQNLIPAPEPLLAPPPERAWHLLWGSEDARYGGRGTPHTDVQRAGFQLTGHAALLFQAKTEDVDDQAT